MHGGIPPAVGTAPQETLQAADRTSALALIRLRGILEVCRPRWIVSLD